MFEFGFDEEIAVLRRRFEGGPRDERLAAAKELAGLCIIMDDHEEVLPLLESMLLDPDDEVCAAAKRGYMACHEAAVMPLTRLIGHSLAVVRERACDALGYLHDEVDKSPARSSLLAALADIAPGVRGRAALALGRMADTSATTVDALAALVRDPESIPRQFALHALGRIGRDKQGQRAVGAHRALFLSALADADPDVRSSACQALKAADPRGMGALPILLERLRVETDLQTRRQISGMLLSVAREEDLAAHLPALVEIAKTQPAARSSIFYLCSELGSHAKALLPIIRESVTSDAGHAAIIALRAITGNTDEVIPALEKVLKEGPFQQRFQAANDLLGLTGSFDKIVPMLERALEESPDEPGVFIQQIGKPLAAVAPAIARAIDRNFDESDWDVMWNLTCAMSALESAESVVVVALCKALTHPSERVQYAAIRGLAHAGPAAREALPALNRLATEEGELAETARETIRAIEKPPN